MMNDGWKVVCVAGQAPHVVPTNDLRRHTMTTGCWCRPSIDDGVMVHHSLDRREQTEGRELRLN